MLRDFLRVGKVGFTILLVKIDRKTNGQWYSMSDPSKHTYSLFWSSKNVSCATF